MFLRFVVVVNFTPEPNVKMKSISLMLWCFSVPAGAQSLTWELALEVQSAPDEWKLRLLDQIFYGVIEVDSSHLQRVGAEKLGFDEVDPAFSLSFTFDGQRYSAFDDPALGLPLLYFDDGELVGIDYAVYLNDPPYAEGSFFQLHADGLMSYSPNGVGEFEGSYRVSALSVPEASSTSLLALAAIFTLTYRKR